MDRNNYKQDLLHLKIEKLILTKTSENVEGCNSGGLDPVEDLPKLNQGKKKKENRLRLNPIGLNPRDFLPGAGSTHVDPH